MFGYETNCQRQLVGHHEKRHQEQCYMALGNRQKEKEICYFKKPMWTDTAEIWNNFTHEHIYNINKHIYDMITIITLCTHLRYKYLNGPRRNMRFAKKCLQIIINDDNLVLHLDQQAKLQTFPLTCFKITWNDYDMISIMSSHGNAFRFTCLTWMESTDHLWIPP